MHDPAEQDLADEPIARIGRAIDDLAAQAQAHGAGSGGTADGKAVPATSGVMGPDEVLRRLADLWAQVVQLDPDVGKRLPTYEA